MTKKIRLIDDDESETIKVEAPSVDNEKLMGFLEAIDWKLWEMLKLMRQQNEDNNEN